MNVCERLWLGVEGQMGTQMERHMCVCIEYGQKKKKNMVRVHLCIETGICVSVCVNVFRNWAVDVLSHGRVWKRR